MLFKKSKPFIRFYSLEPGVAKIFPIIPASQLKREWMLRNEPPDPENGAMWSKNCPGIKMVASAGWIARAPCDFRIITNGDGATFTWNETRRFVHEKPGNEKFVGFHNMHQTIPTLNDPDKTLKTVIKLDMPWRLEASKDVLLLQMPVSYNNESRFTAATGILDPQYAHVMNVQLYWHVLNGDTLIKAGTPLVQYIPIMRSFLPVSKFDVHVDEATDQDRYKEKEFNYTVGCTYIKHDNLKSRLQRVMSVLNKYRKGDKHV